MFFCFVLGFFFYVRTLLIIVLLCVIIQPGLSFRPNAAWDYSVSPLKLEKQDARECARNVLIALCEECPSAAPLPILFLETEMVFEAGREERNEWASQRERTGEREREKERERKLDASYSPENWSMSFWYSCGLSAKSRANTSILAHKCNMEAVNPD